MVGAGEPRARTRRRARDWRHRELRLCQASVGHDRFSEATGRVEGVIMAGQGRPRWCGSNRPVAHRQREGEPVSRAAQPGVYLAVVAELLSC